MSERASRIVVLVAALLAAVPVIAFPYPPMTDFPHHEALVALLRNYHDESLFPPGLYVRNLGHPNQLFHLLAWALSFPLGVTLACKVVAGGAVGGIMLGGARLARHLGSTELSALALGPLALGWLFGWGFVTNLVGLTVLLFALPAVDRLAREPSVRNAAIACALALLVYLGHELMMFVYVGAASMFAVLCTRFTAERGLGQFAKEIVLRLSPAILALGAAASQFVLQKKIMPITVSKVPNAWLSLPVKVRELPTVLVGGSTRSTRLFLSVLIVGFVVALFVQARRDNPRAPAPSVGWTLARAQEWGARHRFALLAAACLGLFFVAPFLFSGAMLVHERFFAPAFAIAAVVAGVGTRPRMWLAAYGLMLPIAMSFQVLPWYGDAARNYADLERLFQAIPLKSSVAALDLDADQGGRPFSVASGLSRVLARRGGRVLYSFAESPVAPVMLAPEHQWNEASARTMLDNMKFRPKYDLTRFSWLLLHASDGQRMVAAMVAVEPEAHVVGAAGEWALFRSKLPAVPLEAPDAPLPEPRPETIGRRLFFIERNLPIPPLASTAKATPDEPPDRVH